MQNAQNYLEIAKSRGERKLPLERVYHNLQNRELFLMAYAKLYANQGALTEGIDPTDTVDGMSLERIDDIIGILKSGTYSWKPTKRVYIPKANGKLRPRGIPSWRDKLLQEVIRMVLTAYYEPQFSTSSHGFRPGRGCHTALQEIASHWTGTKWFIEGDIKGCFDNIDHEMLIKIIGRNIHDDRLLKLLRDMLKAGYMEDWKYSQTYSGTPQGGVISPILSNIYLHELDEFMTNELIPEHTKGETRRINPVYGRLNAKMRRAKARHDKDTYQGMMKIRRTLSCGDPIDPNYRRLKYVRYADDFLIGFVGTKAEALSIKQKLGTFLNGMNLNMSEEKTLITHATQEKAQFLGYEIFVAKVDDKITDGRRAINGVPMLAAPDNVIQSWKKRYTKDGKPQHRKELQNSSDYDIATTYQMEFQGVVNYYVLAYNVRRFYEVKTVYMVSLVKTLAAKHSNTVGRTIRKYLTKSENGIRCVRVVEQREGKEPLIAKFGADPIHYDRRAELKDKIVRLYPARTELVARLLAQTCELCGSNENIKIHHIRKLKDLIRRYQGRRNPPEWVRNMVERRRKTLVVCHKCHKLIHAGTYDGKAL